MGLGAWAWPKDVGGPSVKKGESVVGSFLLDPGSCLGRLAASLLPDAALTLSYNMNLILIPSLILLCRKPQLLTVAAIDWHLLHARTPWRALWA